MEDRERWGGGWSERPIKMSGEEMDRPAPFPRMSTLSAIRLICVGPRHIEMDAPAQLEEKTTTRRHAAVVTTLAARCSSVATENNPSAENSPTVTTFNAAPQ